MHTLQSMKNPSPRIPEMADERTIVEMVRDLLELDVKLERRPGGVRITIDPGCADDPDSLGNAETSRFAPLPVGA